MTQSLDTLTQTLLETAKRAGAEAADVLAVQGTAISIDVRGGALEQAERSEGIDLGLRVLIGKRQACVSASDTSLATMQAMAERAVAMAKEAPEDPYIGLAEPDQLASDWDVAALELADPSDEPSPAALQDDAQRVEAAALAVDGISQVEGASAGYSHQQIHLATSNGFSGGYARTDRGISCSAITGTGANMERDFAGEARIYQNDLPSPESIGQQAAERALARANARQPATGAYPVLFDERISTSLIAHLTSAINGVSVARGSSWLLDAMGEQVLPKGMSLTSSPHRARIAGSKPFDGEGLATREVTFVEDGILKNWVLDLATARQLGLTSNAHAARGTTAPPSPSAGSLSLTLGDKTRDELIAEMGTGLLVTSMIGATINPNTGDYSRGAAGFWVENGEITHAVNECTIAGNLRDMLKTLIPGNDARMHLSRPIPSLLVEGLTLAGK
ncbi:TldD/PmbA family protein [Actibacterium pelagium]|uniref:Modulator protein n=1 Tax=Actibacterium pelagium TaxID=2029103 RepID=A0A917AJP2_9RHOB|nr:TldD/PmbA family protein [Actibacterium pelagium]GGE56244.1 modulator protein [Actibacterium pelagium]